MKLRKFNCPAELTVALMSGRWKAVLVYNLRKGPKRFGQLKRLCPGITATTLTKQLREMEENGLIRRRELDRGALPAVSYGLTERGESLRPVLSALIRWGLTHQKEYVLGDFIMTEDRKVPGGPAPRR